LKKRSRKSLIKFGNKNMNDQLIKINVGSNWWKWDLHVHTPLSIYQNYGGDTRDSWEKFITDLESLPEEFKVIGINDYLFLDGYEKVLSYKNSGRLKKIDLILPILEFRLGEFAGVDFGEYKRPNIHVIFADESLLKLNIIKSQFLATLDAKYKLEKDGKIFERTMNKDSLVELGQQIINSVPENEKSKYGAPEIEGFNNLNLKLDQIEESLAKDCFDGKYFLAVGKTEWDQIKWSDSSIGSKKTLINSCKMVFTSTESVEKFNKAKKKLHDQHVNDLLLDCSDSHNFSDSKNNKGNLVKDRIGKCFTWIKAETTFEGLKQIVYEQQTRIFIGEEKPKKPINTIDSITLKLPTDAKVGEDKFCFAGSGNTYNLNPYFNCFIGGRGSGKSTILNFLGLHSNNPDSPKKFWDDLNPSFDPNENEVFSFGGTEIFEFLAQSEIETFARDKSKFTQAIYDRANSHAGNILEEYENKIESLQGKLVQVTQAVADLKILEEQKITKEKEKRTLEISVRVLSSKDYTEVITGITEKSKELQKLEEWKGNISDLKKSLSELISETESEELNEKFKKTEYEKAYVLAIAKIGEAIELLKEEKFTQEATNVVEIKKVIIQLENKAKTLIEKAGYTPESVEQIKSAPQKITNLESEIKNLSSQIESKTKIIATFDSIVAELKTDKQNYENKITKILKPLQDLLKKQFERNQGKDIKQISLEYFFNEEVAWIALANEFYKHFQPDYGNSERSKEVCEFINENKQTFAKNSFDDIKKIIQESQKNDKKYTKFLDEVFKDDKNFQIFQAIRDNHLYDVKLNKIIQVKYDNRDVEQASFGQRCTAVVVILLLFGNYPLIIDEPEAHLDSSLIANYLVPLLKEKKSDRQIIFATHNANFVINGDAEKIFILRNESGQTKVIETTIEDMKNREELLKLEGGKEAFKKRGEKLDIK